MKLPLTHLVPSLKQKKFKGYVLYGHNEVLARSLMREVIDSFTHKIAEEEELISGSYQVATPSLFELAPDVTLTPKASQLSWYTSFISQLPDDHAFVTFTSSPYPAFLKSMHIGAIACYECSLEESKVILQRYAQKENLNFSSSGFTLCAEWSRSGQWAEVCQLLRLCEENPIMPETIQNLFPTPAQEMATLVLSSSPKNFKKLVFEEPLKIIRSWQKLLMQIWQVKILLERYPPDQAIKKINPPLFFKHSPLVLRKAKEWSYSRLSKAMHHLLTCEVSIKKDISHAPMLLTRFLQQT